MEISQCNFQCHVKVISGSMKLNEQGYKMIGVHDTSTSCLQKKREEEAVQYLMMFLFNMFKAEICFSCNIFTPLSSFDPILE